MKWLSYTDWSPFTASNIGKQLHWVMFLLSLRIIGEKWKTGLDRIAKDRPEDGARLVKSI
jgi:hypothetical protein